MRYEYTVEVKDILVVSAFAVEHNVLMFKQGEHVHLVSSGPIEPSGCKVLRVTKSVKASDCEAMYFQSAIWTNRKHSSTFTYNTEIEINGVSFPVMLVRHYGDYETHVDYVHKMANGDDYFTVACLEDSNIQMDMGKLYYD